MHFPHKKSEIFTALVLAGVAMALCLFAARQIHLLDIRSLRSQIERIFRADITTSLPPPLQTTQTEENAIINRATMGETSTLFAQRPENPLGAAPEITLEKPQLPEFSLKTHDITPPTPNFPGLAQKAAQVNFSSPVSVIALRRPAAGKSPSAALAEKSVRGDYRPSAPRMTAANALFRPAAPEISPQALTADARPRLADISLPVPAITMENLRQLLVARPAGGYPSLEHDIAARLEYSPADTAGRRYFRLGFRLRPESKLPPIAKDVLFLIDVSQSIESRQIRAMRDAIATYIQNLRPGDRWNVFKFSERTYPFRQEFLPAGTPPGDDFQRFFSRPPNEYMTDLFEATRSILQDLPPDNRPCNVFLLTDGFATYGRKEVDQLLSGFQRVNRARFSIMPFMLGDKGMADLLRLLAYRSRGFFRQQKGGTATAAREMLEFFQDYDYPVLCACVANFTNFEDNNVYPAVLPNLYRGQEVTFWGQAEMRSDALARILGWITANQPREFFFRPESGKKYPTGDTRIQREWAFGAAMDQVQGIVEAPSAAQRKAKLAEFRRFLAAHGLHELSQMADLLEKNK